MFYDRSTIETANDWQFCMILLQQNHFLRASTSFLGDMETYLKLLKEKSGHVIMMF